MSDMSCGNRRAGRDVFIVFGCERLLSTMYRHTERVRKLTRAKIFEKKVAVGGRCSKSLIGAHARVVRVSTARCRCPAVSDGCWRVVGMDWIFILLIV
jgi:hypothetical protein